MRRHSPRRVRWFVWWLHGYFRRNFDAVRTSGARPSTLRGPIIVYTNHPSWWDPVHLLLLGAYALPGRAMFGPMDREALERYPFLGKIGLFGVDRESMRSRALFLRTSTEILSDPGRSLWLTAEGAFTDPRARPTKLMRGLSHVVRRLEDGFVVPLAVEYPFWNERKPEALSRFGDPIAISGRGGRSVEDWTELLERGLETTLDALAEDACSRDPRRFRTLVTGRAGVGGAYQAWRRMRALYRGERFVPSHEVHRR